MSQSDRTHLEAAPGADFRLSNGDRLPPWLALLRAFAKRGGPTFRRLLRWLVSHGLGEHLPGMRVRYDGGRVFELPEGDLMYGPIIISGEWEPSESRIVSSILNPGDFVIDIGANHGWYTLLMAGVVGPEGRVLAVEPCPPIWMALTHNLEINSNPAQITARHLALGAEPGHVTINVFRGLPHGHASASTLGRDDYVAFEVPSVTLDSLVTEVGDQPPSLIKLDVEGAERLVLAGAAETLRRGPMVLLEVNKETSAAFGYLPADLLAPLDPYGESAVFRVEHDGLVPETAAEEAPHGTAWLVVPAAKRYRVRSVCR